VAVFVIIHSSRLKRLFGDNLRVALRASIDSTALDSRVGRA